MTRREDLDWEQKVQTARFQVARFSARDLSGRADSEAFLWDRREAFESFATRNVSPLWFITARQKESWIFVKGIRCLAERDDTIMDPLSISASVLTLLGAGATISKGLNRLVSLKNASDVVYSLNNEVTDLHLLSHETADLLSQVSSHAEIEVPATLAKALGNVKDGVLALEKFIAYELTTIASTDSSLNRRVDRSAFLKGQRQIQGLRDRLRADRMNLASATNLLTA